MVRWVVALGCIPALALAVARSTPADPGHQPYIVGVVLERVGVKNAASVDVRWQFQCFPQLSASARFEYTITLWKLEPDRRLRELLRGTDAAGTVRLTLAPGRYRADGDPFFCLASIRDTKAQPERGTPFVVPDFCGWTGRPGTDRTHFLPGPGFSEGSVVRQGQTLVVRRRGSATLRHEPEVARPSASSDIVVSGQARLRNERGACARRGWRVRLDAGLLRVRAGTNRAPHVLVTDQVEVSGRAATWTVLARAGSTRVSATLGIVRVRTHGGLRTLRMGETATFH